MKEEVEMSVLIAVLLSAVLVAKASKVYKPAKAKA